MGNTEKLCAQESHKALLGISVNNNLASRYVDKMEGVERSRCAQMCRSRN